MLQFEWDEKKSRSNLVKHGVSFEEAKSGFKMKEEYDFSRMAAKKNPYASKLKKPVTMRLSEEVIDYFKAMAEEAGVPYQSLINLYLRDCVLQHRKIEITWDSAAS